MDILLYLLMKPSEKKKHEIMSDCLKYFHQLPHNLQCYGKHPNVTTGEALDEIIECANKFTELASSSQQYIQTEIPLFHRFFCRIRDIIFSFLTYYLHMNHFIYIRELLMEINKILLQYRPASGYHQVLLAISSAVKTSLNNMIQARNPSKEEVGRLMKKYVTFQVKSLHEHSESDSKVYVRKPMQLALNLMNETIKSKESTEASLSKLYCLEHVEDIDYGQLEKYSTANSEELLNDCLNRNRFIYQIMKKYEDKFKSYEGKPDHRKNRQGHEFRPTTFKESSPSRSIKKRSLVTSNGKRFSPVKQRLNISESVTLMDQSKSQRQTQTSAILKQQIMNHLYAYRQKCCLRKVMIGAQDIQGEPNPRDTLREYQRKSNKSTIVSKSERAKSYSHRFQVLKSNKCYISGVVSIPFKKIEV